MEQDAPIAPPRKKTEAKTPEQLKHDKFMTFHAEAYCATDQAMKLDEEGNKVQAFTAYSKALELIDKSVSFAHTGGFSADTVDRIEELVYKMRMTRKEILERVSDLQHSDSSSEYLAGPSPVGAVASTSDPLANIRRPPPYTPSASIELEGQGATASGASTNVGTLYSHLNSNLDELALEQETMRNPLPLNAQEVFTISENVQIYFISKDDTVSAPTYPSFLRLVVISADDETAAAATPVVQPPAFLQVGDWTYPLIPGQSPIYLSPDGSYVFPDLRADAEGATVGLILPANLSAEQKKLLEDTLLQLLGLSEFPAPAKETLAEEGVVAPPRRRSTAPEIPEAPGERFSSRVAAGAEKIAHGLVYGAEKTSQYMDKGTTYLVGKIDPVNQKPVISPGVTSGVKKARYVTGKAVKISGYLVSQLSRGTVKLGQSLAPYVQKTATQFYVKTTNASEAEASSKVEQVFEVTGGAVHGIGTVYLGLEHAAKVLAKSVANNTVQVVHHKYGAEAASLADDSAYTIGNTVVTGYNCKGFTPKALVKRVAKDAGKAAIAKPPSSGAAGSSSGTKSPPPS